MLLHSGTVKLSHGSCPVTCSARATLAAARTMASLPQLAPAITRGCAQSVRLSAMCWARARASSSQSSTGGHSWSTEWATMKPRRATSSGEAR